MVPERLYPLLIEAGWRPQRRVPTEVYVKKLKAQGFAVHSRAAAFLSEFGELYVSVGKGDGHRDFDIGCFCDLDRPLEHPIDQLCDRMAITPIAMPRVGFFRVLCPVIMMLPDGRCVAFDSGHVFPDVVWGPWKDPLQAIDALLQLLPTALPTVDVASVT